MRRHELSEAQWQLIQSILPERTAATGRPAADPRRMLNGILWNPADWRSLARSAGILRSWQTVYDHFRNWRRGGVFDRILDALHIRLDAKERSTGTCGASMARRSVPRAPPPGPAKKVLTVTHQEPADHALGRSRGGFTSKFHLVTDGSGLPLTVHVTAGQVHDSTQVETVMEQIAVPQPIGRPRQRPLRLAGDKGYSCQRVRGWLKGHGIAPLITSQGQ